jgi:precorrin-6Y C5,15-methyltransferase (decarboxylating)
LVGLSHPGEVTRETADLFLKAKVLAGPTRLLGFFPDFKGRLIPLTKGLTAWLQEIKEASENGLTVVLASGDPNFYGVAERLLKVLDPSLVQIWPGTTMVQKAFALLKKPWSKGETVSAHGRNGWRDFLAAAYRVGRLNGYLAVYTDPDNTPAKLAEELLERGQDHFQLTVFEDLATDRQRVRTLTLNEASQLTFSPLNLAVLEVTNKPLSVTLGALEEVYKPEKGLITKSEIRSAALGLLDLTGSETFWDIGAGSGSISIEAGRLLDYGAIHALEKDPSRVARIKENQKRFGLSHLTVVHGSAPEDLKRLPDPDRVFVGGGGVNLPNILKAVLERLKPQGVLVTAVISPPRLTEAVAAMTINGRLPEVTQVAVARSQPLGTGYFLKPLTQVYLIKVAI